MQMYCLNEVWLCLSSHCHTLRVVGVEGGHQVALVEVEVVEPRMLGCLGVTHCSSSHRGMYVILYEHCYLCGVMCEVLSS